MQQLLRLRFHIGFPSEGSLYCPVFTQDKIRYLRPLGELANNTLRIQIKMEQNCFAQCQVISTFFQIIILINIHK